MLSIVLSVSIYLAYNLYFFFFFSSRRRHTRCSRDWSSDVCSSDLASRRILPLGSCHVASTGEMKGKRLLRRFPAVEDAWLTFGCGMNGPGLIHRTYTIA